MESEIFKTKYYIRGLHSGDVRIWAWSLADAKRIADRMQVFPGKLTIETMDSDEVLSVKENGVWVDMC